MCIEQCMFHCNVYESLVFTVPTQFSNDPTHWWFHFTDLTIKQEYLEKIASYSDAEAAIYGAMDR